MQDLNQEELEKCRNDFFYWIDTYTNAKLTPEQRVIMKAFLEGDHPIFEMYPQLKVAITERDRKEGEQE